MIDLERVLSEIPLSANELADQLFPSNKEPIRALKRVMAGHAELSASQISKLSVLSSIPIGELFTGWEMVSEQFLHTFTTGEYVAKLDMDSGVLRLFHNKTLFHDDVLFDKAITVKDLISNLNKIVENYESRKHRI